jgi:hypothetical protein
MTAKEYIYQKLGELKSQENGVIKPGSNKELADFIFKTIMSKKFRKFSVTPEYVPHIQNAIETSIANNLPIQFAFPFGGYKLWRLEEAPEADWAELFTIMYYAKWLKPIAEIYEPGIWFDFVSDDVIVERMNNIPKSDTERYAQTFRMILDFLKSCLPENMKFTFTQIGSFYTPEEFDTDLKDKLELMEKQLGGLPVLTDVTRSKVELNVHLKPGQELDPLWREKVELMHQAYYTLSRRRPYTRSKDKILAFCMKMANCVPVGSTKSSTAKFWPGAGVLGKTNEGFAEYVFTPTQLQKTKFTQENISIDGLSGKNFSQIRVFEPTAGLNDNLH